MALTLTSITTEAGDVANNFFAFVETTALSVPFSDGLGFPFLDELELGKATAGAAPGVDKIVFASFSEGVTDIYVMDADGSNQENLTDDPSRSNGTPSWSLDGTKIAFSRGTAESLPDIFVMDADGSNQRNLTNNPEFEDFGASWSPDGTKIAFYSDRDDNLEIYVMDVNGSNQKNLSNDASDDFDPAWSPDGAKIAFTSGRDGNFEIYVMDADGSNPQNLTNDSALNQQPSWSP